MRLWKPELQRRFRPGLVGRVGVVRGGAITGTPVPPGERDWVPIRATRRLRHSVLQ